MSFPRTPAGDQAEPTAAPVIPVTPRLIDVDDVAALLGLSRASVERMNAAGRIPAPRRIGRRVMWDRVELGEWLSRPRQDGTLLPRAQWQATWTQLVKTRAVPSLN